MPELNGFEDWPPESGPTNLPALAADLHAAQSEMQNLSKDSENPFFHSQYLSLAKLIASVREILNKHNISLIQDLVTRDDSAGCKTILLHNTGVSMVFGPVYLPCKKDPQAFGQAFSYARRYQLLAVAGLAAEDDDAEGAMERERPALAKMIPVPSSTSGTGTVATMGKVTVKVLSLGRKSDRHPFVVDTDQGEFSTYNSDLAAELEVCKVSNLPATFSWALNEKWKQRMINDPPKGGK